MNMEQTTIMRKGMATRMREHNEKDERTERNINNGVENTVPKGIRIVIWKWKKRERGKESEM